MIHRLEGFRENIRDEKYDAAIIESEVNIRYLTGYKSESGTLIVFKDKGYLLVDARYIGDAKREARNVEVIEINDRQLRMKELLQDHKVKRVALECKYVTLSKYKSYSKALGDVKVLDSGGISEKLEVQRMTKDEEEIGQIKIAQELTDECFNHILEYIRIGISERDIKLEIENYLLKIGSEGNAFEPIVASGPRGSIPHARISTRLLERGDLVTLDFGAKIQGYCSDMTRTVSVGKSSEEQERVYGIVKCAQEKGIKRAVNGENCGKLDKEVRDYIADQGYREQFTHTLGHGVGLEVHELPRLAEKNKETLKERSIVTIEPGIYVRDRFGVRIEDMVLITEDGNINLTKSSKEFICL